MNIIDNTATHKSIQVERQVALSSTPELNPDSFSESFFFLGWLGGMDVISGFPIDYNNWREQND